MIYATRDHSRPAGINNTLLIYPFDDGREALLQDPINL